MEFYGMKLNLDCYLGSIHDKIENDVQALIDLHTILHKLDYSVCPVCNEWLIMRVNPRLTK